MFLRFIGKVIIGILSCCICPVMFSLNLQFSYAFINGSSPSQALYRAADSKFVAKFVAKYPWWSFFSADAGLNLLKRTPLQKSPCKSYKIFKNNFFKKQCTTG